MRIPVSAFLPKQPFIYCFMMEHYVCIMYQLFCSNNISVIDLCFFIIGPYVAIMYLLSCSTILYGIALWGHLYHLSCTNSVYVTSLWWTVMWASYISFCIQMTFLLLLYHIYHVYGKTLCEHLVSSILLKPFCY